MQDPISRPQQGGGGQQKQISALRSLYEHLGINVEKEWLIFLSQQLFSNVSPTFRRGTIGQWKQHFDQELKDIFREATGDFLIRYGYEQDERW